MYGLLSIFLLPSFDDYVNSFINLFIRLFVHSFIHSFIHSFVHPSIYLFMEFSINFFRRGIPGRLWTLKLFHTTRTNMAKTRPLRMVGHQRSRLLRHPRWVIWVAERPSPLWLLDPWISKLIELFLMFFSLMPRVFFSGVAVFPASPKINNMQRWVQNS